MRKRLLGVLGLVLCFVMMNSTVAEAEGFPDSAFRQLVMSSCDADEDGILSENETQVIKEFFISDSGISNLEGIEKFKNLTRLECQNNQLTTLDISGNKQLEYLNCEGNQIQSLNAVGCTMLYTVYDAGNPLKSSNYSGCSSLLELNFENYGMTSLVINGCTEIAQLTMNGNKLTSVDLTGCPKLIKCAQNTPNVDNDGYLVFADGSNYIVSDPTTKLTANGKTLYAGINTQPASEEKKNEAGISAPGNVKAVLSAYKKTKVTWKKASGAKKYNLYRKDGNGKAKKIKTLTGTSYTDTKLKAGVKYTYFVKGVAKNNKEGIASKSVSVTTIGTVSGLSLSKKGTASVKVAWKKAAGADGYEISLSTSKSKTESKGTVKKSVLTKTISAKAGKTYYVKVRAFSTVNKKKIYGQWSGVKNITLSKKRIQQKGKETGQVLPYAENVDSGYFSRVNAFIEDSRWKHGVAWSDSTHPQSFRSTASGGCLAYVIDFVHEVWATRAGTKDFRPSKNGTKFTDVNDIRTGDVIHTQKVWYEKGKKKTENHYYCVLKRYDDGRLWTAEGNYKRSKDGFCQVYISEKRYSISKPGGGKSFVIGWHMPG